MNAVTKPETRANGTERVNYVLPAVDIYEGEDGYTLEADMPGVARDGLEIYLDQNELTLVGRKTARSRAGARYAESAGGDYRRVFELNPEIDTEKITARVENGVLSLHLAKREQLKPRRITIGD